MAQGSSMRKSPKNDPDQLRHILAAAQEAQQYSYGLAKPVFDDNRVIQLAIEKLLQNIGEATSHLSDQFKSKHDHIPWAKMISMRHRLVHDFAAVDLDIIWDTVQNSLPSLIADLERIMDDVEEV